MPGPDLQQLLPSFPPVDFSFAYGSGVFRQESYPAGGAPMVDVVFAVRDPAGWHARNLDRNRDHYSCLARLGAPSIASIQEDFGAAAYYNTLVRRGGLLCLTLDDLYTPYDSKPPTLLLVPSHSRLAATPGPTACRRGGRTGSDYEIRRNQCASPAG